jgi:mono/diheme cytochrome c family protein
MSASFVSRIAIAALVVSALGFGWQCARSGPWVAPDAEKVKKNPLPSDKKFVEQGGKLAQVNCVTCHGAKGQGGRRGGRRAQPEAGGLDLEARAGRKRRRALLEDLQWPRRHAPWKHLPEQDRWALIRYIRSLK